MRALHLGDLLCAVPFLRCLRAAYPEADVTLIGLSGSDGFVARFPNLVDRLLPFPSFPGVPETPQRPGEAVAFLQACQRDPFDLALQLHGSGRHTNAFVSLMGARASAGFFLPGEEKGYPSTYRAYPGHGPEVKRLLALARHLGWPESGEDLEFPLLDADRAAYGRLDTALGLSGTDYVCLHPGARDPLRRWPPREFARLADALASSGLRVLLTGEAGERPIAEAVAAAMHRGAEVLCGRTTLGSLGGLLEGARLLVTNDTGVSHIAAALCVPSVVLFLHSDAERWAPLDRELHKAFAAEAAMGNSCLHEVGGHRCLADGCRFRRRVAAGRPIDREEVLSAAFSLLEARGAGARA